MTFMFFVFFFGHNLSYIDNIEWSGSVDTFTDDIDELYLNCIRQIGVHPT